MKVYEHEEGQELPAGATDGMEEMLGEDTTTTDWDLDCEEPPHAHLKGK